MSLVIERRNDRSCPLTVCDHCGAVMETVSEGNYERCSCPKDGERQQTYFTHKACNTPFRRPSEGN